MGTTLAIETFPTNGNLNGATQVHGWTEFFGTALDVSCNKARGVGNATVDARADVDLETDDMDVYATITGAVTGADQADFPTILLKLVNAMFRDGDVDLTAEPRPWHDVVANELDSAFWALAQQEFGYSAEGVAPTLRDLLYRILVTDFCRSLVEAAPESLRHFVLPNRTLAANASVFTARWRTGMGSYESY